MSVAPDCPPPVFEGPMPLLLTLSRSCEAAWNGLRGPLIRLSPGGLASEGIEEVNGPLGKPWNGCDGSCDCGAWGVKEGGLNGSDDLEVSVSGGSPCV